MTRSLALLAALALAAPAAAQSVAPPQAAAPVAVPAPAALPATAEPDTAGEIQFDDGASQPVAAPVHVDAATLTDMRSSLRAVTADLQALRAELRARGAAGYKAAGGDKAIDRMTAMEKEISRLTGEMEKLSNRIDRVVSDGTNRIGDIEFRLCELEEGCDLGALTTPRLGDQAGSPGGITAAPALPHGAAGAVAVTPAAMPAMTPQETQAFGAAQTALQAGDFEHAAQLFADFAAQQAGSPAAPEALYLQGAALDGAGDPKGATAAWLAAFAAAPSGPRAPDTLLGLARAALAGGEQGTATACGYLTEVTTRFDGTPQAEQAATRLSQLTCPDAEAAAPAAAAGGADPNPASDPKAAADLADGG